jgi:photosystem II stability/assembly factor-like uncharacterized protein
MTAFSRAVAVSLAVAAGVVAVSAPTMGAQRTRLIEARRHGVTRELRVPFFESGDEWFDVSFFGRSSVLVIQAPNETHGFRGTFLSHDDGRTWRVSSPAWVSSNAPKTANRVFFLNDKTGWASAVAPFFAGNAGLVSQTLDGGQTWRQRCVSHDDVTCPQSVWFQTRLNGLGWWGFGDLARTNDGGATWQLLDDSFYGCLLDWDGVQIYARCGDRVRRLSGRLGASTVKWSEVPASESRDIKWSAFDTALTHAESNGPDD